MAEDGTKSVDILDVEPNTLRKLLSHIYDIQIPKKELNPQLLLAARKYKVTINLKV